MILDEPMQLVLSKFVSASHCGNFAEATILEFEPPKAQMAQEAYKITRYFTQIKKEAAEFATSLAGDEQLQEAAATQMEAGGAIEAVHEKYADDDPEKKAKQLEEIEKQIASYSQFLDMCANVDLYKMSADFGRLITNNKRCKLLGKDKDEKDVSVPLTISLWEQSIEFKDRIAATVRYACFFGLTSSLPD